MVFALLSNRDFCYSATSNQSTNQSVNCFDNLKEIKGEIHGNTKLTDAAIKELKIQHPIDHF